MSDRRQAATRQFTPVSWKATPFLGPVHHELRPEGMTLLEIVRSIPDLPPYFMRHGIICINGEPVPKRMWAYVRPRPGRGREVIVTLHLALAGGGGGDGGGNKNVISLVASIAVVAVAAAISGGALATLFPAVFGASFQAGGLGAILASTAVGVAGSLAVAALTPPPSLSAGATATALGDAEERAGVGTASLSGNVLRPGGPIPMVVGTHRVFPPLAGEPLLERVGDEEIGEAVYVLAGPHRLEDIRVGRTSIAEIDDIQFETREGAPGEPELALVTRQGRTEQVQIELSRHRREDESAANLENQSDPSQSVPRWHAMVSRDSPDEIWLTLTWPGGHFDQSAATSESASAYRIRIRERGTSTWYNLPEIHFRSRGTQLPPRMLKIMFMSAPVIIPQPAALRGPYLAFTSVPGQNGVNVSPATAGWTADSHFYSGSGDVYLDKNNYNTTSGVQNVFMHQDRVELYVDLPKAIYEVEIRQGWLYDDDNFTRTVYQYAPGGSGSQIYDFFEYYTSGVTHRIPESHLDRTHTCAVPRISSVWNEPPIPRVGEFAAMAIRVKSRSIDRLSVLASPYVHDYNAGSGAWDTLTVTSNPAPHFRAALVGPLLDNPLNLSLLDDADLVAWRQHCIDQGYECNAVLEGRTVLDALLMIASCGKARPRQSETWGVMVDKDRSAESPVQMFSFRNMKGFSFEKAFADLPDGLRARFNNAAKDYEEDEIIVFDPASPALGKKLEDIKYDGLVYEDAVRERAYFDMAQARARSTFWSGETNFQALVCRRGDLVAVQHDLLSQQAGAAFIRRVIRDDANPDLVVGLELDGSISYSTEGWIKRTGWLKSSSGWLHPSKLGVSTRLNDGTIDTREATGDAEPEATRIAFVTPINDPDDDVVVGQMVVSGRLAHEYKRMLVLAIMPKPNLDAALTFVDEAPELHA